MTSDAGSMLPRRSGTLPALDYALPNPDTSRPRVPGSGRGRLAGLAMYALALWMALANDTFRTIEARMVTPIAGYVTGNHPVIAQKSVVFFALHTSRAFGLQITTECTTALLLIPLLVMMGSIAIFTRFPLRDVLAALAAGATLMLLVNIFRIVGIAWATWQYGFDPGYKYSHVFVGSACSLVGFVGAVIVALWVLIRRDRKASGLTALSGPFAGVDTLAAGNADGRIDQRHPVGSRPDRRARHAAHRRR